MQLNSSGDHDEDFVDKKIELEERKLLVAQRKLESIRLLDELLERVKVNISRPGCSRVGPAAAAVTLSLGLRPCPGRTWTSKMSHLRNLGFVSGQNDVSFATGLNFKHLVGSLVSRKLVVVA